MITENKGWIPSCHGHTRIVDSGYEQLLSHNTSRMKFLPALSVAKHSVATSGLQVGSNSTSHTKNFSSLDGQYQNRISRFLIITHCGLLVAVGEVCGQIKESEKRHGSMMCHLKKGRRTIHDSNASLERLVVEEATSSKAMQAQTFSCYI